jgi:hypothetical protein
MRLVCLAVALMHLLNGAADAKCARIFIEVEGTIERSPSDDWAVRLGIDPEPHEAASAAPVKERHFQARAAFDPTSGTKRGRDRCSRLPTKVTVFLLKGDEVIDRKTLQISDAFERTPDGDYRGKKPVVFTDVQ